VVCGRRRRTAATAASAAGLLLAVSGCATTEQISTAPTSSASSATTPAAVEQAEQTAVEQLQAWLADPQAGTLTYNAVQVTADGSLNVMSILSGPFDPALGQAQLTGSVKTLGSGSSTQGASTALESAGTVFTTIPQAMQTGGATGMQWNAANVTDTWGKVAHSGWWTVLDAVRNVTSDGITSLAGTTVYMYSDTLDLTQIKGIPKQLLDSDPVRKAGVTKVEVDVYLEAGTGALERVTYKLGLPVQIDAAATAKSSAGYQVDMSGFASASATASPTPQPTPSLPATGTVAKQTGDVDLAALLPF
jgi:hypothetical protein